MFARRDTSKGIPPLRKRKNSGIAENSVREIGCDRNAESLALIGLDHQQNPEDGLDETDQRIQSVAQRKNVEPPAHHAQPKKHSNNYGEEMQAAENHDRLGRVK